MNDSHARSLLKGVTWRLVASTTTMLIVYIATGDLALMAGVGVADVTLKILFYYTHERLWGRVRWGQVGVEPQPK
jgi:adenylylsulfate kinase